MVLILTSGINLLSNESKYIHATESGFLGGKIVFDKFFKVVLNEKGEMLYYETLSCPPELLFNCVKQYCTYPEDMCPCYQNFN